MTAIAGRVAAIVLLAALWDCTTLAPIDARRYIPAHRPPTVWLTLRDGSSVELRGPHAMPDGEAIFGFVRGGYQRLIPFSDITAARATRAAPMRSALLVGGAGIVLAGLLVALTH